MDTGYRFIADDIARQIAAGQLRPNEPVPSQRAIARAYGVSGSTALHALAELRRRGLTIAPAPGRPTVVRPRPVVLRHDRTAFRVQPVEHMTPWNADRIAQGQRPAQRIVDVSRVAAPAPVAELLGVEPDALVVRRRRLLTVDSVPVELSAGYYTVELAGGTRIEGQTRIAGGLLAYAEGLAGEQITHFVDELTVRWPEADEAELLAIDPAWPVLHERRTAYTASGRAIEVDDAALVADLHHFKFEVQAPDR